MFTIGPNQLEPHKPFLYQNKQTIGMLIIPPTGSTNQTGNTQIVFDRSYHPTWDELTMIQQTIHNFIRSM